MDAVRELQTLKEDLIREIDEKIERVIKELERGQQSSIQGKPVAQKKFESIYPLTIGTGIFKGKRPIGIIFEDNCRKETPTWKKVMEEILKNCNEDSKRHQALMDLRGRVMGRNRVLLGSEPGKMRSPVKIDQALYVETHYDTESLLRILTTRILDAVGYDYNNLRIAVQAE